MDPFFMQNDCNYLYTAINDKNIPCRHDKTWEEIEGINYKYLSKVRYMELSKKIKLVTISERVFYMVQYVKHTDLDCRTVELLSNIV